MSSISSTSSTSPPTSTPIVASLDAFGRDDLPIAGGKGANLGELRRAGFAVPPGFVATTAAYDRFVAAGGLGAVIKQAVTGLDVADTTALARASEAIRQAFDAASVPDEVAGAVRDAYRRLGGGGNEAAVAVRSSATAEDLPGATFAGQQETYLNVIGEAALLDAVRSCWASLWLPRSIAYRQRQGIDHRTVKLAVVVQELVDAEVAGVLFTANPITGARDELVIDASPGLGEAVVSWMVTPDHHVLKKGTWAIVERQIGRREVVIRPAAGGGTAQTAHPAAEASGARCTACGAAAEPASQPALSEEALREIAQVGEAIERHYGTPQDVEWAWASGRCYVLQARSITALPPLSAAPIMSAVATASPALSSQPASTSGREGWRRGRRRGAERAARRGPNLAGELFPLRPYPLDIDAHLRPMLWAVGNAMATPLGIRFPSVEDALEIEDGVPVRLKVFQPRPTWRVVYKPWLTLWQRRYCDLLRWQEDSALVEVHRRVAALDARDLTALSWLEVVATLHEAMGLGPAVAVLRDRYLPSAIWSVVRLWLLLRLTGQQQQFGALLTGVETKTLELNRELERLAGRVQAEAALRELFASSCTTELCATLAARPEAQAFWAAFQEFQRVYGHRETAITLCSQPSWREAPEIPLGVIKALVAGQPRSEHKQDTPAAWERVRDDVLAHSVLGKVPLRRAFVSLLERARVFPQLREDTHFYFGLPLPQERRAVLELARRLVEAGALDVPGDVFYLTLPELEGAGDPWPPSPPEVERLRALVSQRKARWQALAGQPFVDPNLTETPETPPEALLAGTPGSAGVAEGPVRLVHGPEEFGKLQPGDVLVAPYTNPAWTPLFVLAAAVVVDTGGAISHAAIVAREYGVPAVMGTRAATTRLTDGQRVRVDGTRGLVFASDSRER